MQSTRTLARILIALLASAFAFLALTPHAGLNQPSTIVAGDDPKTGAGG